MKVPGEGLRSLWHPGRWLAAFAEDALPPARQRRVAAHLRRCSRCAARLAAIERGLAAARGLAPLLPSAELDRRVLAPLASSQDGVRAVAAPSTTPSAVFARPRRRRTLRFATATSAAIVALALVAVALVLGSRRGVEVEPASASPGRLESLALASHRALDRGELGLAPAASSPAAVRRWLGARGLAAALADARPAADAASYRLVGAADVSQPGLRAAVVRYEVDGGPLTLVVARQEEVPDAPRWSWHGKRVRYRDADGAHLLTWTNSGEAYTLAAPSGARVQRGCLLCHAEGPRAALAARLVLPGSRPG